MPLHNVLSHSNGYEVSRLFAAMLQLVNDQNVKPVVGDRDTDAIALKVLRLEMQPTNLRDDCRVQVSFFPCQML